MSAKERNVTSDLAERSPRSFAFGPFVLHPARHLLLQDERPVRIGSRALDILTALVERPGELVGKRELIARVWPDTFVDEGNLKVNMAALRRVLARDPAAPQYIATVVGRGYRFVAPVRSLAPACPPLDPGTGRAAGRSLPGGRTRIFGRAAAIEAIRRDLEETRLVSVVGAGGVGKTTVAIAAAWAAARARAQDGTEDTVFVDLATIADPQFIPAAIASALGLGMTGGDPLAGVLHALKSQRRTLLFDNCEHLLPAVAAAVERLIRHLDGLRVLATSREPLRLRGERVHRLDGLDCDPRPSPTAAEARAFPANELFAERAFERAAYRLTDADAPAVAETCRRLEGNALAIELAATQTAAFAPARILQMLDDRFRLLQLGPPGAPLRQQSLLATLEWSYSLLSEREAALLRAVSVFAGDFGVEGAMALSGIAAVEALDTLGQLAAKSLLATNIEADSVLYRLAETTRAYCLERLRLSGEDRAVRRRHAEHVCSTLERAAREWTRRPARDWGAAYGRVLDDLRAALAWAGRDAADRTLLIRLTIAGGVLWNHFSQIDECRDHVARAIAELAAAGLAGTAAEMRLQTFLAGATMFTRGPVGAALEASERALAIAVRIGDVDHHLRNLWSIAVQKMVAGEHDEAFERLRTFLAVASAHDRSALPDGERLMGRVEVYLGRLRGARERLERLFEQNCRRTDVARFARFQFDRTVGIGCALANAQWLTGSPETAARTADATVAHGTATGHELSLISCLAFGACPIALWNGRHADGRRYLALLDDNLSRHGVEIWRCVADYYRGAIACAEDRVSSEGVDRLRQAIADCDAARLRKRLPHYMGTLAEALVARDRLDEAAATLRSGFERAAAQDERWCLPELLRVEASLAAARGRPDEAERLLAEALAVADELGALAWRLRAANDLARLWCGRGRAEEAGRLLQPIYDAFTEGFATPDLAAAAALLAGWKRPAGGTL